MSLRYRINNLLRQLEKPYATHNRIEVSRAALLHNINLFEQLCELPAIPVLKGNAYGHGIMLAAKALKDQPLRYIAVDGYFEALRIREVSRQPVLIMGAIAPENFQRINYDHYAFVVQDEAGIHGLGKTGKSIKVHLEINTGMNRYGAKQTEIAALTRLILSYKNLTLEGVMSHLADSDGTDITTVEHAVKQFDTCIEAIHAEGATPSLLHIAQSAGSLKAASRYANAFRLGIGLYGINPFPQEHPLYERLHELRPALTFTSTITKIIDLKKDDRVSYNYTFTAPKAMRIGVLPVGYYEGVNRALSNTGVVKVGNTFAPIVGRVCMNHTMIDLSDSPAAVGDEAIIYSNNPYDKNAINPIAAQHGLFSYNLLTALSPDVRRQLIE